MANGPVIDVIDIDMDDNQFSSLSKTQKSLKSGPQSGNQFWSEVVLRKTGSSHCGYRSHKLTSVGREEGVCL